MVARFARVLVAFALRPVDELAHLEVDLRVELQEREQLCGGFRDAALVGGDLLGICLRALQSRLERGVVCKHVGEVPEVRFVDFRARVVGHGGAPRVFSQRVYARGILCLHGIIECPRDALFQETGALLFSCCKMGQL